MTNLVFENRFAGSLERTKNDFRNLKSWKSEHSGSKILFIYCYYFKIYFSTLFLTELRADWGAVLVILWFDTIVCLLTKGSFADHTARSTLSLVGFGGTWHTLPGFSHMRMLRSKSWAFASFSVQRNSKDQLNLSNWYWKWNLMHCLKKIIQCSRNRWIIFLKVKFISFVVIGWI